MSRVPVINSGAKSCDNHIQRFIRNYILWHNWYRLTLSWGNNGTHANGFNKKVPLCLPYLWLFTQAPYHPRKRDSRGYRSISSPVPQILPIYQCNAEFSLQQPDPGKPLWILYFRDAGFQKSWLSPPVFHWTDWRSCGFTVIQCIFLLTMILFWTNHLISPVLLKVI